MNFDETDLRKLLELNQKGLISDEILAKSLNERYLQNEKKELSEEEKREELARENRERAQALREKFEQKAIDEENNRIKEEAIATQDDEIETMILYLGEIKNSRGEYAYSISYLQSLGYLDLLKLYNEIKAEAKNVFPISVKKDYIDSLTYINKIKQDGTIVLALAKDEFGEMCYVVYQNKYDVIGFDRIDPKSFKNISEAQEEYEARILKEKEDLEIYLEPKEPVIDEPKEVDSIFKEPIIEESEDILTSEKEEVSPSTSLIPIGIPEFENKKEEIPEEKPQEIEKEEPIEEKSEVEEVSTLEKEESKLAPSSEGLDIDELMDVQAENATKPEIDTGFKIQDVSSERKEKLKSYKEGKKKLGLKILIIASALGIITSMGGLALSAGIVTVGGALTYSIFAKKIENGSWNPTSEDGLYIKHVIENIMHGKKKEGVKTL